MAQQHEEILLVVLILKDTSLTHKHNHTPMLTYQSVPPAPGRRWCGTSHYRNVRGWSLCISETQQQWPPRPLGSAIGRIWTLGDAAALVGIPYHAPLDEKKKKNMNIRRKMYHQTGRIVCMQRILLLFSWALLHPPPLPAGIKHVCKQTQRDDVAFYETKTFYGETKHMFAKEVENKCLFLSDFLQFVLPPQSHRPQLLAKSW